MAEYIERDKAVEKITAYCELRQAICLNDKDEFLRGLQTALKAISYNDVIPAADVQPVKRGKWIDIAGYGGWSNTYYQCPECKTTESVPSNFCPNCGADMRGEGNEV